MQLFNGYYRVYFKNRMQLKAAPYACVRALEFECEVDLITSTTGSITVQQIPNAVIPGDVVMLTSPNGEQIYRGVIDTIEGNKINTQEILSLLDDEYCFEPNITKINKTVDETPLHLLVLAKKSVDAVGDKMARKFLDQFEVVNLDTSNARFGKKLEPQSTFNLYSSIKDLFNNGLIVNVNIPLQEGSVFLECRHTEKKFIYRFIDNTVYLPLISVTDENSGVNKLNIFRKPADNESYAYSKIGTWYLTTSGLTQNANQLNRLAHIKTKNVFLENDADANDVKAAVDENISNILYAHEIEIELLLENKLYDYHTLELGQKYEVMIAGKYYQTVLTGLSFSKSERDNMYNMRLKFGKSRTSLTARFFQ